MPPEEDESKQEEAESVLDPPAHHGDDAEAGVVATTTDDDKDDDEKDDKRIHMTVAADAPWKDRMWEVFVTFWPLGLVAFGGPQAHVAILRDHLVVQRDWLDEEAFTELFAIGQVRETRVCVCERACVRVSISTN